MGAREMHGIPHPDAVPVVEHGFCDEYSPILAEVTGELFRASQKFPPMRSGHEGWAILLEEVDELYLEMNRMWEGDRRGPAGRGHGIAVHPRHAGAG